VRGFIVVEFASRAEAGRRLGLDLAGRDWKADLVLGLPRGGVVVAAEVARILQIPLDVLVVRKIGQPRHREFATGALAEGGVAVWDSATLMDNPAVDADLDEVVAEEMARLRTQRAKFHQGEKLALAGKQVLIVDDGLATGATMEAAVRSANSQNALRVMVAVPVASASGCERMVRAADEVVALVRDENFNAVGAYYGDFEQTSDEEVLALLRSLRMAT
jgi:predicted phosphoribosyltransferase